MTAKKVLHMHFGKEGGAERFLVTLARALAERGVEQRFIIRPDRIWRDEVATLGPVIESNSAARAPLDTSRLTIARSRSLPRAPKSASNCSSGMARGIRCCCFCR